MPQGGRGAGAGKRVWRHGGCPACFASASRCLTAASARSLISKRSLPTTVTFCTRSVEMSAIPSSSHACPKGGEEGRGGGGAASSDGHVTGEITRDGHLLDRGLRGVHDAAGVAALVRLQRDLAEVEQRPDDLVGGDALGRVEPRRREAAVHRLEVALVVDGVGARGAGLAEVVEVLAPLSS